MKYQYLREKNKLIMLSAAVVIGTLRVNMAYNVVRDHILFFFRVNKI